MINWYYVEGTERIGPISEDELYRLISGGQLGPDSYVWRKGFSNWEHIRNVSEINLNSMNHDHEALEQNEEVEVRIIHDGHEVNNDVLSELNNLNSEISFSTVAEIEPYDWEELEHGNNREVERLFLKTGLDRHSKIGTEYGPYSAKQIIEAYEQKRINDKTFVFTLGANDWQMISAIPFFKNELGFIGLTLPVPVRDPLHFVYVENEVQHSLLVKVITNTKAIILTNLDLVQDTTINVSLFQSNHLIKQNVTLTIESKNKFDQTVSVILDQINSEVEAVIQEYNE